jgi:VanZ family protein
MASGLSANRCWGLFTLIWAGFIFWLALLPSHRPAPLGFTWDDKLLHAGAFFVLAWGLAQALGKRVAGATRGLVVMGFAALYGAAIEYAQYNWPVGRTADYLDWLFDLFGTGLGLALVARYLAPASTPEN